jgi:hypothetical protein
MISSLLLSGCISYQIPSYSTGPENTRIIDGATENVTIVAEKPSFEDTGLIFCRGAGPVKVLEGKNFTDYIVGALEQELKYKNIYNQTSENRIKIKLTKVDFSTALGATNWYIDGQYLIGEKSVNISTVYNDRSSYFGNVACQNMALYFPKAVSQHLNQLYNDPIFNSYLKVSKTNITPNLSSKLKELEKAFQEGLITEGEFNLKRGEILNNY